MPQSSLEFEKHDWYSDIIYCLKHLSCPPHLVEHRKGALRRLKANKYCLLQDGLGWKNPDGVILRCVGEDESKILQEFHAGYLWRTLPCPNHCT